MDQGPSVRWGFALYGGGLLPPLIPFLNNNADGLKPNLRGPFPPLIPLPNNTAKGPIPCLAGTRACLYEPNPTAS